ncbi:pseudouridine synthase [uncultured Enterococcus sp.]|uniref:pseudouridine synthase n=1 Tax=uncultured Enterococcus sp. TaxID=167972 RepID=UPI002AA93263|nr:pseudouridine synthase [uncultured Enterococcus sp.]
MRLDKFLSETGCGSRKEVKKLLKQGIITVNNQVVKDAKSQVNEWEDQVAYDGEQLHYQKYFYYMLHKPQGVISATEDKYDETVIDLLSDEDFREDLFPVGRLDKDTEGLLILTNDGQLSHRLLSPKKHVDKEYFARISGVVTEEDIKLFAQGLILKSGEAVKPGKLVVDAVDEAKGESEIRLVIQEGKFHQVKRMFEAVDKQVVYLKRLRMGELYLDEALELGDYRPLTATELQLLEPSK